MAKAEKTHRAQREILALEIARSVALSAPTIKFHGELHARLTLSGAIPTNPGVYLFFDLRGVLYIGKARNLRRRFRQHLLQARNRLLAEVLRRPVRQAQFGWIRCPLDEQFDLEKRLIHGFRHLCNDIHFRRVMRRRYIT